jgi:hypothetical protein
MLDVLLSVTFSFVIIFSLLYTDNAFAGSFEILDQFTIFFASRYVVIRISELISSQAEQNKVASNKSIILQEYIFLVGSITLNKNHYPKKL